MSRRVVVPELLDHLPAEDPEARRSRRDLRRINILMGNERWVCRTVSRFPDEANRGIVEIGAGDGILCSKLAARFPQAAVAAYDLAPVPLDLAARVEWHQGDLFEIPAPDGGGVLVANLFLHHFEGEALTALGRWLGNFEVLVFNEPDRAAIPHALGGLLHPWINRVTRHDMHVSIRAGFAAGEISRLLGLDPGRWRTRESSTWRGARRVVVSST
ncbi:MAG: class I SAM-dependent methyltransferase [Verrucomicrobiota bacterium]